MPSPSNKNHESSSALWESFASLDLAGLDDDDRVALPPSSRTCKSDKRVFLPDKLEKQPGPKASLAPSYDDDNDDFDATEFSDTFDSTALGDPYYSNTPLTTTTKMLDSSMISLPQFGIPTTGLADEETTHNNSMNLSSAMISFSFGAGDKVLVNEDEADGTEFMAMSVGDLRLPPPNQNHQIMIMMNASMNSILDLDLIDNNTIDETESSEFFKPTAMLTPEERAEQQQKRKRQKSPEEARPEKLDLNQEEEEEEQQHQQQPLVDESEESEMRRFTLQSSPALSKDTVATTTKPTNLDGTNSNRNNNDPVVSADSASRLTANSSPAAVAASTAPAARVTTISSMLDPSLAARAAVTPDPILGGSSAASYSLNMQPPPTSFYTQHPSGQAIGSPLSAPPHLPVPSSALSPTSTAFLLHRQQQEAQFQQQRLALQQQRRLQQQQEQLQRLAQQQQRLAQQQLLVQQQEQQLWLLRQQQQQHQQLHQHVSGGLATATNLGLPASSSPPLEEQCRDTRRKLTEMMQRSNTTREMISRLKNQLASSSSASPSWPAPPAAETALPPSSFPRMTTAVNSGTNRPGMMAKMTPQQQQQQEHLQQIAWQQQQQPSTSGDTATISPEKSRPYSGFPQQAPR